MTTNFDDYTEDANRYCWSFRRRASDDDLTPPPEQLRDDNSTCSPKVTIKRQDSATLIDASHSPTTPLRGKSVDLSVTSNISPVPSQQTPRIHSAAFHQALARSTNSASTTMSPKRKSTVPKPDANDVPPQRKSTRTSKPTAKKATATETLAGTAATKKPTTRGKKAVAESEIETDEESDDAPGEALSKRTSTKSVTPAASKTGKPGSRTKSPSVEDGSDATDSGPNELGATPSSEKRALKPATASAATISTQVKQKTVSPSKRTASEIDSDADSESDDFPPTPPSKKTKSLPDKATTNASASAPLSRSTSPSPEPTHIAPPAAGADEIEAVVSQPSQLPGATVNSPLRDEKEETSLALATDEETEDDEAGPEEPEAEDEALEGWTVINKDTAIADTPHTSEDSTSDHIIDSPETEHTPETEAAPGQTKPVPGVDSNASTVTSSEASARSPASGPASTTTAATASDNTSSSDSVEFARRMSDAQATLKRITPSITNLMIAAIKHNRSSVDVYPQVQRMSGQAFALKVELERIGQMLERAVASVEILDRDFGRLADEARRSGLTNWK